MILSGDHSTMMEGWELPLGDLREQSHHPWSARPAGRCSEMAASVGFLLLEEARMFSKSGRTMPPALFCFFRIILAILGLLCFHLYFRITGTSSVEYVMGNLIGITLNL